MAALTQPELPDSGGQPWEFLLDRRASKEAFTHQPVPLGGPL